MLGLKSTLALGLLSLVLTASCFGFYQKAKRFEEAYLQEQAITASYKAAVESSNKAIQNLNERIKTSQRASQELSQQKNELEKDFQREEAKLKSHIGRLEKAFNEKPKLMEKIINKSFNDFIDKVSCNSGNLTSCKEE